MFEKNTPMLNTQPYANLNSYNTALQDVVAELQRLEATFADALST